jgi:mRNA-degrading endonuclease toxin of MazEF toxin-antitoxin module
VIRQGEIRKFYSPDGQVFTVVVLTSDSFNEQYAPLIAPLMQRGAPDLPPALVKLHDTDSISGVVDLREMGTSSWGRLDGDKPIGTVTGITMMALRQAVNDLLVDLEDGELPSDRPEL